MSGGWQRVTRHVCEKPGPEELAALGDSADLRWKCWDCGSAYVVVVVAGENEHMLRMYPVIDKRSDRDVWEDA